MGTKKWSWEPAPEFVAKTNVHRFMTRLGFDNREDFLKFSVKELETFWAEMVKEVGIEWFEPYTRVLDTSSGVEWARWFVDGKLNIAWNCLERHARGAAADNLACLAETEDGQVRRLTFAGLDRDASKLAHGLASLGLRRGDRVAFCLPMIPEVVVALYACFKLGLIVVPIFSGFGPGATATRLEDSGARVVITADSFARRGKLLPP